MYLVAGLGNPGREYAFSRHNMGFRLVDSLGSRLGVQVSKSFMKSRVAQSAMAGTKVILAKPQTYMNLSGHAVVALMNWYKIPVTGLIVVYDDMDLELGRIRIRGRGSHGGHKGMQSVIENLGTVEIARVRLGVGRPEESGGEVVDWVLGPFSAEEEKMAGEVVEKAVDAVTTLISGGLDLAMNRFNG